MNSEQQPNISFNQTTEIKCKNCNSVFFKEVNVLRKVSKILTGQPDDKYIPMKILRCDDCGEVNQDTLPTELKEYFNNKDQEHDN